MLLFIFLLFLLIVFSKIKSFSLIITGLSIWVVILLLEKPGILNLTPIPWMLCHILSFELGLSLFIGERMVRIPLKLILTILKWKSMKLRPMMLQVIIVTAPTEACPMMLLRQNSIKWAQKARLMWIQNGDHKTNFFFFIISFVFIIVTTLFLISKILMGILSFTVKVLIKFLLIFSLVLVRAFW